MTHLTLDKYTINKAVDIIDQGSSIRFRLTESENDLYLDVKKKNLSKISSTTALSSGTASVTVLSGRLNKNALTTFNDLKPGTATELQAAIDYAKETFGRKSFLNGGWKWFSIGVVCGLVLFYVIAVISYANPKLADVPQDSKVNGGPAAEQWKP